jgi:hypothetical protein
MRLRFALARAKDNNLPKLEQKGRWSYFRKDFLGITVHGW